MEPTKRTTWLIVLSVGLLTLGCGSTSRHLCKRAAECDYIGESDVDECTSDLQDAIADKEIDGSQVRECLRCAEDNECGADTLVDCASDCETVGGIVFLSNF